MKAYLVIDASGSVDVFLGNGDELTPAALDSLGRRVRKLGGRLLARNVESASELAGYVMQLESEAREIEEREPTDEERRDWAAEDKHDFEKEGR